MNRDKLLVDLISYDGPELSFMEVCGTHTSAIVKGGLRALLSPKIRLVSGPGCPVCVTPAAYIDKLVELSLLPNTCVLSFGDMLRVRGREYSLDSAKAMGGRVRMIASPLDALKLARAELNTEFIIAAVGFETTIPSYSILLSELENIRNVRLLTSLKSIIPALEWICRNTAVNGFLCPGHVSAVTGVEPYKSLAAEFSKPFVVAGFDSEAILIAVWELMRQCRSGKSLVKNFYPSVVSNCGNIDAMRSIDECFEPCEAMWRGIGSIESSGYRLKGKYTRFDAGDYGNEDFLPDGCRCGEVILGRIRPDECPFFGSACTPDAPLGPCMVSQEGACGISIG